MSDTNTHRRSDLTAQHFDIEPHLAWADRLAHAGTMVGDQHDFHIWRQRRNSWIADTFEALLAMAMDDVAAAFRAAATARRPLVGWEAALPAEIAAVEDAARILAALPAIPA
jgi:hypothetical protein